MKAILRLKEKVIFGFWMMLMSAMALAGNLDLNDISGTSGAGNKQITDLAAKGTSTMNVGINLVLAFFAFVGICMVGFSVKAIHKASKEERESPTPALVGIAVGSIMTIISVIVGVMRNFFLN